MTAPKWQYGRPYSDAICTSHTDAICKNAKKKWRNYAI